ncbi:Sulfate adenylyltransferase subunit 1 [Aliarcobacter thereius]|uniref:Sulfate adenylyltransferase subunit 1 n=2 Tax=Aliarcobacter thereius TaxID=544718 RepID=A0A5R9H0N2_9BACT|nr:sulfate adenylyltransferase subunit CysN [Aliarcobacter thereius]OCL88357.1 Sulfate adenylyltransferase subunit 1 [Aliarcobacter thereius]OCL91847.1 Sulfate adenylyltransferase subunit 1 [Aliarcobacter thereius]OCL95055.1 Sulfate adenylyltransferase subunit 1 [Aliarcobacter thereius LMG 24486]QBF16953.1 sulfate adenylyltransferase, GTPase subunit CysN [Aliarcobacter thereius LMG 24486]TLS72701.1 sulfate adenylyltransferase subunit CysN [Aliarcobacter thereius]
MEQINDIKAYLKEHENKQLLRFITCGNVDDGKSTLIGRLLHDSKTIFEDQLENIKKDSKKNNTTNNEFDLSLLVDGLQSEREQGITIDVAYRYFTTPKRKFIIADTPGHEQYTRNMATGASTANLAIILIDARYGVQTQTKRHTFINKLLGIDHIVVAVNKMDLVDFKEEIFESIKEDYLSFAKELEVKSKITLIPLSALNGDNIVDRSTKSPWYKGETLLEYLENVKIDSNRDLENFRFPVQYVNRPNLDFRGFCGTIASGVIKVGDEITVIPSNKSSKIKSIVTYEGDLTHAYCDQAITLTLEDEIDVSRGDIIVKSDNLIDEASSFDVDLVWLSENALVKEKQYFIKRATTTTSGTINEIYYKTDVNSLKQEKTDNLVLNEIARVKLDLEQNIAYDSYDKIKTMGSFIIIDRVSNNTVGAGMIRSKSFNQKEKNSYSDFEIEFNALVRKHFPHWNCKEIIQ